MPSGASRLLFLGALLLSILMLAFYWHYSRWSSQAFHLETAVQIQFEPGESLSTLGRRLTDLGLLQQFHETKYLRLLAWQLGVAAQLQAGEYELSQSVTPRQLLERLAAGQVITHNLIIAEGTTAQALLLQLQNDPRLAPLISSQSEGVLSEAAGLKTELDFKLPFVEGAFLPETYQIRRGDKVVDVLQRAHDALVGELDSAWQNRKFESPLSSPAELLILASIIEKETGQANDRADISQVFHLRLVKGMRLQTDPTVIYALGDNFDGNLRRRDLRVESPFNTYRNFGLPPTAIALPSRLALQAAAQPASGNYLYFVARGDGSSQFSKTLDEHNRAVAKYQLGR